LKKWQLIFRQGKKGAQIARNWVSVNDAFLREGEVCIDFPEISGKGQLKRNNFPKKTSGGCGQFQEMPPLTASSLA